VRPVTDAFLRTVRGSHTMNARARVCTTFQTGTSPTGTDIPVLDGDVVSDANADVRSTLDMTTDGNSMWPTYGNLLLAPYGNEVFVERGIEFGNGSTEWVSLGYFRIQEPTQDQAPNGPIRIAGRDRMAGLIDARLVVPAQFLSTATYATVVSTLVTAVYPTATIQWDSGSTAQIGRSLIAEEDRYGFLNDLVTGLGKIWYWDYRGVLVIRDQPSTTTTVFDINSGQDGVLVNLSRKLTRESVYNAVVATGEAADTATPVRAAAIDANPNSPTYYFGRFGPVPRFYSSPSITGSSQAASAAASLLRKQLGLRYEVNFAAVPNPALEPWDCVRVTYSGRTAVETHVIDRITIPLTSGAAMTATTREQSVVLVGAL
jgi:hypothetical protein